MVPNPFKAPLRLTPRLRDGLIVVVCVVAQATYLLAAWFSDRRLGFPLDDAWIYQTYARNLAHSGQWAFVPGVPSSGSTSIWWTPLIVPAHLLSVDPRGWTYGLGLATLIAAALGAARLFDEDSQSLSLAVGLAVALEWHLVWASASGMETGLCAALLMWFWVWVRRHDPARLGHRWLDGLILGVWGGVLLLGRPEGILAAGAVGLYGLACRGRLLDRLRWAALACLGLTLLLVPFLGLNYAVGGTVWPNTFYAKQTEYAVLWQVPYLQRLLEQSAAAFVGPQIVMIPGLLVDLWRRVRARPVDGAALLPLVWVVLHWALYAARLPVTYQHGRYAIPTVGVVVIYSVRGMVSIARPRSRHVLVRMLSITWLIAAAVLFPVTLGILGAPAYVRDVAFIEEEMVATAHWVADHTAPDAVIAAHDIGALGYFAPRKLVDLAGLVSPDVLSVMHSAEGLDAYLATSGADYLIVFPGWNETYARLVSLPRYQAIWSASEREGYRGYSELGPMTVYRVAGQESGW